MAIPKLFSVTAQNQLQLVALLMWEGTSDWFRCYSLHPRCYGTQQDNFEWPQRWICSKTYSDFGTNFCQTYGSCHERKTEATLFILFRAMTVITSTSDRPNVNLVHVWKSIKKRSSFEKENSALSEHTTLANHTVRRDKSKIITTKSGVSTPPTLLEIVKPWHLRVVVSYAYLVFSQPPACLHQAM